MNAPPLQGRSRAEVRVKLIFLIKNKIQKGRMGLLYQLYQTEIHTLSLAGAAKFITTELGLPIGIQTIRTLRKKGGDLESMHIAGWEEEEVNALRDYPMTGTGTLAGAIPFTLRELEGFKPLDVFSEEYTPRQSTIKWAQTQKA